MALTVNTNVASLNAQRNLYRTGLNLNTALKRLSSGLRINSAKDDAAGLAIANKMTSQIRGLNVAVKNANDSISMAQTAEGALQESTNILHRMRELSLQSLNGTYGTEERNKLDAEYQQLKTELTRISDQTKFNGVALLDGTMTGKVFQVGYEQNQVVTLSSIGDMDAANIGGGTALANITTSAQANTELATIDAALNSVDTVRARLGAFQNRMESTIANLQNVVENVSASRSRIMDADFAMETANLTRSQILQQSGIAMLAQANMVPQAALSLIG